MERGSGDMFSWALVVFLVLLAASGLIGEEPPMI
jgi:hypothetical protein